jgi:NAD(P)-dependent dehydrogenase (short-subunit alcohol dehydrogenase family)
MDLCDLISIKEFIKEFLKLNIKIDILIHNAGVNTSIPSKTKQGFEITFGVNFIGTSYLNKLILENNIINKNGRIITVSSEEHRSGNSIKQVLKEKKINFGDFFGNIFDNMYRYRFSKLCLTTYILGIGNNF